MPFHPQSISHQPSSSTKTSYSMLVLRWTSCLLMFRRASRGQLHTAVLRLPGPKPVYFFASYPCVFARRDSSQDIRPPMMLGSAAAAFPASFARARARDCNVFFTHFFKPPLSEGGAGIGVPPPPSPPQPPVSASASSTITCGRSTSLSLASPPCTS